VDHRTFDRARAGTEHMKLLLASAALVSKGSGALA
jgi:hypothetical protein